VTTNLEKPLFFGYNSLAGVGIYFFIGYESMTNTAIVQKETVTPTPLAQLLAEYSEPVKKLISFESLENATGDWPDYTLMLGLNLQHVPELIRMATDDRFDHRAEDWEEDNRPYWAPLHAVRALGQLHATEAMSALLTLLSKDDDWLLEELPKASTLLGPSVLPELMAFFQDSHQEEHARVVAADTLAQMAQQYPESRALCLESILSVFQDYRNNERNFNSLLLASLLDMKAVEAADLIQEAFAADCIDETFCGDWIDVKHRLGLPLSSSELQKWTMKKQAIQARISRLERQRTQETAEIANRQFNAKKSKHKRNLAKAARKHNRHK
jgi:hypothetical protein